jgi:hypothetical protein
MKESFCMSDERFVIGKDYDVPLLRLLCKLPGGQGETAEVCRLFEIEYRDRIPEEHRGMRDKGSLSGTTMYAGAGTIYENMGSWPSPGEASGRLTNRGANGWSKIPMQLASTECRASPVSVRAGANPPDRPNQGR